MTSVPWNPTIDIALRTPLTHRLCVACIAALFVVSFCSALPAPPGRLTPILSPIHSFSVCGGVPVPC